MKKIAKIFQNEFFWLGLILAIAAFLRLYKIQQWQYFTYDQARDYLIVKKMMMDNKFTLVGPTVSIAPGVFLPPTYYYSLIPFLWLFRFRLVGPDVYTAILGVGSVYIFYLLAKNLFDKKSALFSAFIFALNPYLIQASRHAWNPNSIVFFVLLFALSCYNYFFSQKRKYLIVSAFSLGWAISLHLTAVLFVPIFIYALYKDFRRAGINYVSIISLVIFGSFFSPLIFFDIRHNFPISNAIMTFFSEQKGGFVLQLVHRGSEFLIDSIKVPLIFWSGLFLKENITIRPSDLTLFSHINLLNLTNNLDKVKIFGFSLIFAAIVICLFFFRSKQTTKSLKFIFSFIFLSFLTRFLFPVSYFFFYYYLILFPFLILIFTFGFFLFLKKNTVIKRNLMIFFVTLLTFVALLPSGLKTDTRAESYFLPPVEIIANDFVDGDKIAIAANSTERLRWDKNGLEYRYLLEAYRKIPLNNWEETDYRFANVLYLIDEGNIPNPLSLGGMEMETFKPKKIVKTWEVKTGQKIYKMTR